MTNEYHSRNPRHYAWPTRGWLAGLALAAQFVVNPLPNWVAACFILPLFIDLVLRGVRLRPFIRPSPIIIIICVLAIAQLLALPTTQFQKPVITSLVWTCSIVGIVLLASDPVDSPSDIIKGLFGGVCLPAIFIAVAGLVKYMLQLQGYVFGFLINSRFDRYPQGTTFSGDYNHHGLFMLVAAIGLSIFVLSSNRVRYTSVTLLALAAVMASGFFAGSRRFTFVAPLVPVLWLCLAINEQRVRQVARMAILPLVVTVSLYVVFSYPYPHVYDEQIVIIELAKKKYGALPTAKEIKDKKLDNEVTPLSSAAHTVDGVSISMVPTKEEETKFQVNEDKFAAHSSLERSADSAVTKAAANSSSFEYLAPRSVSPKALTSTMTAEELYGFGSRWERWSLGWQLIKDNGYLLGSGFRYHQLFACQFVNCAFIDYPHAPVLAAWVAFGAIGLLLALGFYIVTIWNISRSGFTGVMTGASFFALAVMPYSLISGDSIFSLPQMITAALLVNIAANNSARSLRQEAEL